MHTITLLHKLSRNALTDMAKAAVDLGQTLDEANVFEHGTDQHREFRTAYLRYEAALAPAD